jgi:hypothetical protein
MIENPATGEVIVDFVTWPADHAFVEFNVFKYARRAGGGLIAQQYALRDHQDTTAFLRGLRPVRERLGGLMAKEGLRPAPSERPGAASPVAGSAASPTQRGGSTIETGVVSAALTLSRHGGGPV